MQLTAWAVCLGHFLIVTQSKFHKFYEMLKTFELSFVVRWSRIVVPAIGDSPRCYLIIFCQPILFNFKSQKARFILEMAYNGGKYWTKVQIQNQTSDLAGSLTT